jgi:hypothetical protein
MSMKRETKINRVFAKKHQRAASAVTGFSRPGAFTLND